ncbi:hypothetical protein BDZ89DRAFT_547290 [Hymenopellis radicata]|nr:hypothetical protein BDZ89DRAFT_547290 [Hymenopellis radicata]
MAFLVTNRWAYWHPSRAAAVPAKFIVINHIHGPSDIPSVEKDNKHRAWIATRHIFISKRTGFVPLCRLRSGIPCTTNLRPLCQKSWDDLSEKTTMQDPRPTDLPNLSTRSSSFVRLTTRLEENLPRPSPSLCRSLRTTLQQANVSHDAAEAWRALQR